MTKSGHSGVVTGRVGAATANTVRDHAELDVNVRLAFSDGTHLEQRKGGLVVDWLEQLENLPEDHRSRLSITNHDY